MNVILLLSLVSSVLRIASGPSGGNYHKVAQFIKYVIEHPDTEVIDSELLETLKRIRPSNGELVEIVDLGGSGEILDNLIKGSCHLGIAQSDITYKVIYLDKPKTQLNIYAIAILFEEALHLIKSRSDTRDDIKSFSKVVVLNKRSGSYYTVRRLLPPVSPETDIKVVRTNDAFFGGIKVNTVGAMIIAPPWKEMEHRMKKFQLVPLTKEEVKALTEGREFHFIKEFTITRRHYKELGANSIRTVSVSALLLVNKEKLAKLLGGKELYDKFVLYLVKELHKFFGGERGIRPKSGVPKIVDSTMVLLEGVDSLNLRPQIAVNWDENARSQWEKYYVSKILFVIAISFLIGFAFLAAISKRWKYLILRWLRLIDYGDGGRVIFLSRSLRIKNPEFVKRIIKREDLIRFSFNSRFLIDFMGISMFLLSMLFVGLFFSYTAQVTKLSNMGVFIAAGISGMVLSFFAAHSLMPERLKIDVPLVIAGLLAVSYIVIRDNDFWFKILSVKLPILVMWAVLLIWCVLKCIHRKCVYTRASFRLPGKIIWIKLPDEMNICRITWGIFILLTVITAFLISFRPFPSPWVVAISGFAGMLLAAFILSWILLMVRREKGIVTEIILLLAALMVVWVWGGLFLYQIEKTLNPSFDNPLESLWSVVVYLFSGLEDRGPVTLAGRILASLVIFIGSITVLSTFTAILSSFFTERRLKEGGLVVRDYKKHIVVCNWNSRGEKILNELIKSPKGKDASRIVVLTSEKVPEEDQLREVYDECQLTFLRGNPLVKTTLGAIDIDKALAIIVLADESEEIQDPDAHTALILLSIKAALDEKLSEGQKEDEQPEERKEDGKIPLIIAEAVRHNNMTLLQKAGADIVVCSEEFEGGLIVQSANYPELFDVYRMLLQYSPDTNEFYLIRLEELAKENPALFDKLLGKSFSEVMKIVHEASPGDNPAIVVGIKVPIEEDEKEKTGEKHSGTSGEDTTERKKYKVILNPKKKDRNKLFIPGKPEEAREYSLIVMCYSHPELKRFKVSGEKPEAEGNQPQEKLDG